MSVNLSTTCVRKTTPRGRRLTMLTTDAFSTSGSAIIDNFIYSFFREPEGKRRVFHIIRSHY